MEHIVKRKGHKEAFDARKVYASVFAACMVLRMSDKEAELLSDTVAKEIVESIKNTEMISSLEIHKRVVGSLRNMNHDLAFIYDTHRDIS